MSPDSRPAVSLSESMAGGLETIVALATPPGRSAISVIRLSGRDALDIAQHVIRPWPIEARRSTLCTISNPDRSEILDQALVTVFVAPESFTGENLVEISGHGGLYVPAAIMDCLITRGARQALPGEFSRRAVLNGKLDITQAEAIGDLIDARSKAMHRAALGQLDGGLSRRITALRSSLISVESLIAYDIDFPEEDDGPISRERVSTEIELLLISLDALLATVPVGEMIREGAVVVIAGRPNVGKSSLFNSILGQSRAIVTDIPGTTRDAIEGVIETENWPVRLVDTAGLRDTEDTVEKIGIEVSERYLQWANVVLACGDSEETLLATVSALDGRTGAPIIRVRTKSDLEPESSANLDGLTTHDVEVSSETGEGLELLLGKVDQILTMSAGSVVADMPVLTRSRHIHGIHQARAEIAAFGEAWDGNALPAPVAAVHLRTAITALESLVGAISTDDVLDRVFSSFCVGK
ncbi:MAG TPA: tRNA uridine-5-carboxymethylaminomethyl(34) synthesis GTPase MnmE [Terriglobia bacterium]|nr:tRNA uridine-5-carboxymethylaminomethyl(34) synthesis GTPase MnmE [Terriglobia bacterium]